MCFIDSVDVFGVLIQVPTATASANLYSLIETAKANGREPYQYLSWMLNKLPSTSAESIEDLMPWNMPTL